MVKKSKPKDVNLYYLNNGHAEKNEEIEKKRKMTEREKRIKENKKQIANEAFDEETEEVIRMTNKNKIQKEEQQRKQITKKEIKRKKRNKLIKKIIGIIGVLVLSIGGIVFALISPVFNIKNIIVEGNNLVSSEMISNISGLSLEQNIFKYRSSNIKRNIKENSYVENVKIKRKIPNTVLIEVTEREPRFSISFMGKYVYINSQGYFLEISEDSKNLLVINGIETPEEQVIPGNRMQLEDLEKLEDVIKIMNIAQENNIADKFTSIDIKDKNEYIIYSEVEQKTIHIGNKSNLSNKILFICSIFEKEKAAGDIFINGDINKKFDPYFREKLD